MQKKLAVIMTTACAALMLATNASAMVCPFTDHFNIQAPLPLRIMSTKSIGNIELTQISTNRFDLTCKDNKNGGDGDVVVTIGMDNDLSCDIAIHDGPLKMNPTINYSSCAKSNGRLFFMGMDHRLGSYDYTLKFTM